MRRLRTRRSPWWARDHLAYRALWPALEAAVAQALAGRPATGLVVVDVGCGERPYADLFDGALQVGVDLGTAGASPDVLASALQLPLASGCADLVFTSQVIEHVTDPATMLAECARVLKPGGALVLSGPFWWPLHEEPHDHFRFTEHGLALLLRRQGLVDVSVRPTTGSLTQVALALVQILPRWMRPLQWGINLATPALQRLSADRKSTVDLVALARKP